MTITPVARRVVVALCLLAAALPGAALRAADGNPPPDDRRTPDPALALKVQSSMAALPMRFEAHREHVGVAGDFVARGAGYAVLITGQETTLLLHDRSSAAITVRMRLAGASRRSSGIGLDELPGVSNHLRGSDARKWRTGVRGYGRVEYRDVYPGVSVAYYGNQQQLEYDFIVAPGANHRRIALTFEAAR
jgi:hypothetical protein